MYRGDWQAQSMGRKESDTTEVTEHTRAHNQDHDVPRGVHDLFLQ